MQSFDTYDSPHPDPFAPSTKPNQRKLPTAKECARAKKARQSSRKSRRDSK